MAIMARRDCDEIKIHMSDTELTARLDDIMQAQYLHKALERLKDVILDEMAQFLKEQRAVVDKLRYALESAVIHIGETRVPPPEKRGKVLEEAYVALQATAQPLRTS